MPKKPISPGKKIPLISKNTKSSSASELQNQNSADLELLNDPEELEEIDYELVDEVKEEASFNQLPQAIFETEKSVARSQEASFARYLREINKFPLLTAEEELYYAIRFSEHDDKEAGKKLIQSHLRLVVKTASKFRKYGLPIADLVAEGNLGLIQALKKFEPHKGFRFSTYAIWWIRAFLQDYVLRSWSMVKIGTTLAQKKLFFNLRKIRRRMGIGDEETSLIDSHIEQISSELNVSKKEVYEMNSRLSQSDISLNKKVGFEEDEREAIEMIADDSPSPEQEVLDSQEKLQKKALFETAFEKLNDRERDILLSRQLNENSITLEELSQKYQVSRERIRQVEENAIRKIKKEISAILAKQNQF
jgi:RNA polymerase sigma-32 factor